VGRRQEGPRQRLFYPCGLCFVSWPLVSEGAICYKVTFIWCGINVFFWTWNDRKRIWFGTHISCLCVCRVRIPTWFLSLTNNVENQFWWVFSTTLQYPNFYHSVISIFDGRRCSVNIDSTIGNKMKIETSMTSQVGKNSRPYFQCVHHRLVLGKHPQRQWHNSKVNSWYWQLVYIPDTGMVSVFFFLYQGHTFTENRLNTWHRQQIRFVSLIKTLLSPHCPRRHVLMHLQTNESGWKDLLPSTPSTGTSLDLP